jgi:hypothetical protein
MKHHADNSERTAHYIQNLQYYNPLSLQRALGQFRIPISHSHSFTTGESNANRPGVAYGLFLQGPSMWGRKSQRRKAQGS